MFKNDTGRRVRLRGRAPGFVVLVAGLACAIGARGQTLMPELSFRGGARLLQPDLAALESPNNGRTSSTSRSKAECLICQLHQNLSTSEINHASVTGATESQLSFTLANVAVHLSEFADARRGRAPPTIL